MPMFHLGQSTTASFADASASASDQLDGESDFAYALRTSSDAGLDPAEFGAAAGAEPGFGPDPGLDPYLDGVFDTPLAGAGADFGFGETSYSEADPSFDSSGFETFSVTSSLDPEPAGEQSGGQPGQPAPESDEPDVAGDWEGDLTDAGLDEAAPPDPGLDA